MKNDLNSALQSKADKIALATEKAIQHINDWQQIMLYIRNRITEDELTPTQLEKMKRYNSIYSEMLSNKYDEVDLPGVISKLYKISEWQARQDIDAAKELWSKLISLNKMLEIRLGIDTCKRLLRKAEELNDMKAAAMIDKNLQKYRAMLPDEEAAITDDFVIPEIEGVFNPELLGVPVNFDMAALLQKINDKREMKINTEIFEDAQEIKDDAAN